MDTIDDRTTVSTAVATAAAMAIACWRASGCDERSQTPVAEAMVFYHVTISIAQVARLSVVPVAALGAMFIHGGLAVLTWRALAFKPEEGDL